MRLHDHCRNVYSQHGEDGMLEKLLEWLDVKTGTAVEFGAWDGLKFSNTAKLWRDGDWRAVLIESNEERFRELTINAKGKPVLCRRAHIGLEAGERLDDYVEGSDLIVIDIDGNDLAIFEDTELRPKIFVIEFNQTIPAWVEVWSDYAPDNKFGASLGALCRAAAKKGYIFVGASRTNGFFVRGDIAHKLPKDLDVSLRGLPSEKDLVYLMTNYDGEFTPTQNGPHGLTHYYDGTLLTAK